MDYDAMIGRYKSPYRNMVFTAWSVLSAMAMMDAISGTQKKTRVGSHTPKKERNRNGKRYYQNGRY